MNSGYRAHPEYRDHEKVVFVEDEGSGLRAVIAIHSTALGPAAGGCRVWRYENEENGLRDALRLSRGMTYKNAIAGLDLGGGKAVIMLGERQTKTDAMMLAFGRAVEELGGQYYTAEDVGVNIADMQLVYTQTRFVAGLSQGQYASGDPSPITARGVFEGIRVACSKVFGTPSLDGVRIAVQGIGNVGWSLCSLLSQSGAELIVTDVDAKRCDRAVEAFGAKPGSFERFHATDCDVYAPCALGGVLTRLSIPQIKAKIVAGAANNQLEREADADALHALGITYMPDFLINAGGILNVAAEIRQVGDPHWLDGKFASLVHRMGFVLDAAADQNISPNRVALDLAEEIIRRGRQI